MTPASNPRPAAPGGPLLVRTLLALGLAAPVVTAFAACSQLAGIGVPILADDAGLGSDAGAADAGAEDAPGPALDADSATVEAGGEAGEDTGAVSSPEGGSEGGQGATMCLIGGQYYPVATTNPGNPCLVCDPSASTSSWSNAADGTKCDTGNICHAGACVVGCEIDGAYYADGAPDPSNVCQVCKASATTSVWTNADDGTTCARGVCASGKCAGVAASISANSEGYHTCVVTSAGGVECWGFNADGELGNNSKADSAVSVGVSGLSSGVTAVAAGGDHTCALTSGGAVECWGQNQSGALGNNSSTSSLVPVGVSGLSSGILSVASGAYHSCAKTAAATVQCWGYNPDGALGDNTTTASLVPVAVSSSLPAGSAESLTAGEYFTCALTNGGGSCWGEDTFGQLGNNSTTNSLIPVYVDDLPSGVESIVAGASHACAVATVGTVQCWGDNTNGQLGNNSTKQSDVPIAVSGLAGVMAIAAGRNHTCALTTAGAVQCWGDNAQGQLGNNSTTASLVPGPVSGLGSGVVAIAAGKFHNCAIKTGGAVWCWGYNYDGELGNNAMTNSLVPVEVIRF